MKEPHIEGVATHDDPESCVGTREGAGEVLTGVRTGTVLSREISPFRDADAVKQCGRQHWWDRYREVPPGPARSKTRGTCGTSLRENREIPRPPALDGGRVAPGSPTDVSW